MDRIEALGGSFSFKRSVKKRKKKKTQVTPFASLIEAGAESSRSSMNYSEEELNENIEEILDNVHITGEILVKTPTMENIRAYRSAVKAFMQHVIGEIFEVEQKTSGKNVLKRKRFTLINTINYKIESLTAEVLRGQTDQLDMLERVNEINGLIIDLLS